jgi:hypothetical protein
MALTDFENQRHFSLSPDTCDRQRHGAMHQSHPHDDSRVLREIIEVP